MHLKLLFLKRYLLWLHACAFLALKTQIYTLWLFIWFLLLFGGFCPLNKLPALDNFKHAEAEISSITHRKLGLYENALKIHNVIYGDYSST